jgi:hypothetical protein
MSPRYTHYPDASGGIPSRGSQETKDEAPAHERDAGQNPAPPSTRDRSGQRPRQGHEHATERRGTSRKTGKYLSKKGEFRVTAGPACRGRGTTSTRRRGGRGGLPRAPYGETPRGGRNDRDLAGYTAPGHPLWGWGGRDRSSIRPHLPARPGAIGCGRQPAPPASATLPRAHRGESAVGRELSGGAARSSPRTCSSRRGTS